MTFRHRRIASVAANPTAGHPDPDGAKIVFVTRGLLEAWDMRLGDGGRDTENVVMAAFGVLNYLAEARVEWPLPFGLVHGFRRWVAK